MNYICEDNINFYDLLKDDNENNENNDNNNTEENYPLENINLDNNENKNELCLISNLPLDITHIELPCKHKFNYYYIYNDIFSQKKNFNPYGNTSKVLQDLIICPYCRKCIPYLLPPALDIKNVKNINNVNSPKCFCLRLKCNINNYCKDDILCNIEPCNDDLVYVTPYGKYCQMHYKIIKYSKKRKERIKNKTINKIMEYPSPELVKYERKFKLSQLKELCIINNLDVKGTKKDIIIRLYNNNINF